MTVYGSGEITFVGSDVVGYKFERQLSQPVANVWRHLMDRRYLAEWITSGPGGYIRPRLGGEVYLPTIGGAVIRSGVFEYEPERSLGIAWQTSEWMGGTVTWELAPDGEGTHLIFEHAEEVIGPSHITRTLANWHMMLDLFGVSLAGKPVPWNWDLWQEYFQHYVRNLPYAQRV